MFRKSKRFLAILLTIVMVAGIFPLMAQAASANQVRNGEMSETSNGALTAWSQNLISGGTNSNTVVQRTSAISIGGTNFTTTNAAFALIRSLSGGAVPFNAALEQTMLVSNGTYTLQFMSRNNIAPGDSEAAYARVNIISAGGNKTYAMPRNEGWTQHTVEDIVVTNNKLTISFEINSTTTGTDAAAGRALAIDRVTVIDHDAAQISGTIRDSSGAIVPYAFIRYLDAAGNTISLGGGDLNGNYTITGPQGTHTVRITKAGYADLLTTITIDSPNARTGVNYAFPTTKTNQYTEIPRFLNYPEPTGNGQVYYISSSKGDDANDGLTMETAWRTFSPVNTTNRYSAGSVILLKAGDVWSATTFRTDSAVAGTASAPITVGMYVDPAAPSENAPRIDANYAPGTPYSAMGTTNLNSRSFALEIERSYWHVYDLELTNWGYNDATRTLAVSADRGGARIRNQSNQHSEGVILSHVYIHHVNGSNPKHGGGYNQGQGVGIAATNNGNFRINNMRIENNLLRHISRNGIVTSGWNNNRLWSMPGNDNFSTPAANRGQNNAIRGNILEDIWGDGILVGGAYKTVVERNLVINTVSNPFKYPNLTGNAVSNLSAAVWSFDADAIVFQFNEICYTGVPRDNQVADGQAFDSDYYTTNNLYQYNYTHNNEGGFFMACGPEYSYTEGTVVRYNLSVDDGSMYGKRAIFQIGGGGGVHNTWIYNNTIYTSPDHAVFQVFHGEPWDGLSAGTHVYNNIFSINGQTAQFGWPGCMSERNMPHSAILNNNLYHGRLFGPGLRDFPPDENPVFGDPMFVNPGNGRNSVRSGYNANLSRIVEECAGYKLKDGSPAIGAGRVIKTDDLLAMFPKADRRVLSVNDDIDFFGNKLTQDSRNIGACENV